MVDLKKKSNRTSAAVRVFALAALAAAVLSCCSFDFAKPSFVMTTMTAVSGKKDTKTTDKSSEEQIIFLDQDYSGILDLTFEAKDGICKYKLTISESGVCVSEITSDESGYYVIKLNDSVTAKAENIKKTAPSDLSLADETAPFRIAESDTGRARLYGNKKEFSVYLTPEKNRYCLAMRIQMNDDATWSVSALTSNFTVGSPAPQPVETTPFYESPEFIAAEDSIKSLENRVSELEKQLAGLDFSDELADESRRLTDYVDSNSASFRTLFIVLLIFQVFFAAAIVVLAIFVLRSGVPVSLFDGIKKRADRDSCDDKKSEEPDSAHEPAEDYRGDVQRNFRDPDFNIVMPAKSGNDVSIRKRLRDDVDDLEKMSADYKASRQPKPEPTIYVRISNYNEFKLYDMPPNSYIKLRESDSGDLLVKNGAYVVLDGDYVNSSRIMNTRIKYLFDFIRPDGSIIDMRSSFEITRIVNSDNSKRTPARVIKPAIVKKDGDVYTLVEKGTLELRV